MSFGCVIFKENYRWEMCCCIQGYTLQHLPAMHVLCCCSGPWHEHLPEMARAHSGIDKNKSVLLFLVGEGARGSGVWASAAHQGWKPVEIPHLYWHNAKFKEIHPPWEQSVFNELHWSESLEDKAMKPLHRGIQGLERCLLSLAGCQFCRRW